MENKLEEMQGISIIHKNNVR